MNASSLISSLERFGPVLPAIVRDVPRDDARWKPPNGAWSIVEIVRHLGDEETEDFRTRVRLTLEGGGAWPPIDPEGAAKTRRYNDDDLAEAAKRFNVERKASVQWLSSLRNADWSRAYQHPKFGPIHAGDLLTAWAAHDALHLRQVAKRMFQLAERDGAGFSSRYAGEWTV